MENQEFHKFDMHLFRDSMQNYKVYQIPKAQLIIADVPYNLGTNAYGSNPSWYVDGDNKNGESDKAGKKFFNSENEFRPAEFMHFCSKMLIKEPKEKGKAPCMILFCEFEQQFKFIELAKKYGFPNYINLVFRKNFSAQVLKANYQKEVWHLAAIKMGRTPTRHEVYTMVKEIANTMRDAGRAFSIAYNSSRKEAQRRAIDEAWMRRGAYRQNDGRADALEMLRRLLTENCGNYTKVPMLGHTRLDFCHPGYGHADYNKVRTCAIEGNKAFCEKVCEIAKRHLAKMDAA